MLRIHRSIVTLVALTATAWAQGNYSPVVEAAYPPADEVPQPHDTQRLTVFLPDGCPPEDTGRFPVLLYSPASAFLSTAETLLSLDDGFGEVPPLTSIPRPDDPGGGGGGPKPWGLYRCVGSCPPPPSPAPSAPSVNRVFLTEALAAGWAVVTVGTTGWNSWPTCGQLNDCNPCNTGAAPSCFPTAACWDTNLWYAPNSPQWNDFTLFWGEKEFTWARQWVGLNAEQYGLDNDRVVVCGTSTGAIYSAFLAFGPDRSWGASYSAQAQQDTRVAGLVAFEPNTWLRAATSGWQAVHWPSSTDEGQMCDPVSGCSGTEPCFNRRAASLGPQGLPGDSVAAGVLEESSISRWVREIEDPSERPTPVFIAAGDGMSFPSSTPFARDARDHPDDYDRYTGQPGVLIPGDPLLTFAQGPELALHDSWYAMNFAIDLQMLDATNGNSFHEEHSRLYLMDDHVWASLPPSLSTTGLAPASPEEVLLLDGVFEQQPVTSIDNTDLVPLVIAWMEEELDIQRTTGLATRNPALVGPGGLPNQNPAVYSANVARLGKPTQVRVDLSGTPDYEVATVIVFGGPYAPGAEVVLTAGQALLCDIDTFLFSLSFAPPDPSGIVTLTLPAASPLCSSFCTQAILVDTGQAMPFALTNAVDITILP